MEPTPSTTKQDGGPSRWIHQKYADQNPCATHPATSFPPLRGITTASAYWHTPRTLARWCRIRSYLDSTANHGLTALDAITRALAGDPWLPAPSAA
jgi:hypothetical protein